MPLLPMEYGLSQDHSTQETETRDGSSISEQDPWDNSTREVSLCLVLLEATQLELKSENMLDTFLREWPTMVLSKLTTTRFLLSLLSDQTNYSFGANSTESQPNNSPLSLSTSEELKRQITDQELPDSTTELSTARWSSSRDLKDHNTLSDSTEETLSLDLSNQRTTHKDSLGTTELDQSESSATGNLLSQEERRAELWSNPSEIPQIKNSPTMEISNQVSREEFLHSQNSSQAPHWFILWSRKANHNNNSQLKSLTSERSEDWNLSELPILSSGNKSTDVMSKSYQEDQKLELEASPPEKEFNTSNAL